MKIRFLSCLILAAAAAASTAVAAAFDREGLIVPYAEDHFPDIASMRYYRSPYYRAIDNAVDSATLHLPADWVGRRIVVGVGYPSDTLSLPDLTINGVDPGPALPHQRHDVTHLTGRGVEPVVTLRGLGKTPRRVYAYATPKDVWVESYHLSSSLDSTDLSTGIFDMEIELGGVTKINPAIAVEYMLFDASRHQVAAGRADAAPNLRFRARIPRIHPWSTDDPYRYLLAIILRNDRTGQHIMTVGSPMRFANYTAAPGRGPELNSVSMSPLSLAALDSIPTGLADREALVAALRASGANAVIAPPGINPDTDWRNFCADRGLLCFADGALDPMILFAADPADAEHPQLPGGMERMAARYSRVMTELVDTTTLTLAARTRSPFAPLSDFTLDYELTTPSGEVLTSGNDIVIAGEARTRVEIPLAPPSPGGLIVPLIPDDVDEAFLNIAWRPLRPMAGAEVGEPTARRQFIIGRYRGLDPIVAQKLKRKGNTWYAGGLDIAFASTSGLPTSLKSGGRELLGSPVGAMLDGVSVATVATSTTYDKSSRTLRVKLDLQNASTRMPLGNATVTYTVGRDRELDIKVDGAPSGFALTFPSAGDRIYLGRGPGHSPATDPYSSRIALYQAKVPEHNSAQAHAETRRLTLLAPAGSPIGGYTIRMSSPVELTLTRTRAILPTTATLRLKAL